MKILVIEDDDKFRSWLLDVLKKEGYQTYEAYDGRQALKWIQENHKDVELVITDIIMPQVDGLEILFELRKNFPHISAITISEGSVSLDYCVKVSEAVGSKKFLKKPFQSQDVIDAIRSIKPKDGDIVLS